MDCHCEDAVLIRHRVDHGLEGRCNQHFDSGNPRLHTIVCAEAIPLLKEPTKPKKKTKHKNRKITPKTEQNN
jgi:hypothetical protein